MTTTQKKETLGFQTEVKQMLHLMIHSLYSNKEIFLRELISNASDACDKLRFEALNQADLLKGDADLKIQIEFNEEANTVTIRDNGIGMSREEVVENLGTIAKSGTAQFLKEMSGDEKKDANLIGQFGVGFYSSFIVAKEVSVTTRRANDAVNEAVRWTSEGEGEFSIETVEKAARGTEIVMSLKADENEFANGSRLRTLVKKYADHISVPVEMLEEKAPAAEEGEEKKEVEEAQWEAVNSARALWTRGKTDVSDEEYQEFYKHVSHDYEDALTWSHNKVEGKLDYTSLLFIPRKAPFDMWEPKRKTGVKLYAKRVFIMEGNEALLPQYLRFIKGVIDTADLSLNVSREILQGSKVVDTIRKASVKRILGELDKMSKNRPEDYAVFWSEFGMVMKEGIVEDFDNKEKIAALLRFATTETSNTDQNVSLADYISRIKEDQKAIYYITADTHAAAKGSPHLEIFKKKGIEVLLLTDRVDEWLVGNFGDHEGLEFKSITKGDLEDLDSEGEKEEKEKVAKDFDKVIEKAQSILSEKVKAVKVSSRLSESPSCLVADENELGSNMERIMKSLGQDVPETKPILEINPDHPLVKKLKDSVDEDLVEVLFDQAVLSEGGQISEPAEFVKRINKLMMG